MKFHDFPGFPWSIWTLFYIKCKPWKDYEYITSYIDNSRWNIRYLPIKLWSALRLVIVFCAKLVESFYCNGYKQTGKWGEGELITDFGNRTKLEVESEDKNQYQDTKVITMANHNRSMHSIKLGTGTKRTLFSVLSLNPVAENVVEYCQSIIKCSLEKSKLCPLLD